MKLIELLARDLDEWVDTTVCYVQDANGDVWPCKSEPELDGQGWEGKYEAHFIDQRDNARHLTNAEQCEDWATAIIIREQWEATQVVPCAPPNAPATVTTPNTRNDVGRVARPDCARPGGTGGSRRAV